MVYRNKLPKYYSQKNNRRATTPNATRSFLSFLFRFVPRLAFRLLARFSLRLLTDLALGFLARFAFRLFPGFAFRFLSRLFCRLQVIEGFSCNIQTFCRDCKTTKLAGLFGNRKFVLGFCDKLGKLFVRTIFCGYRLQRTGKCQFAP